MDIAFRRPMKETSIPLPTTQNESGQAEWTDQNDIFLVSDLHIADGRTTPFGKFTQGENFFWDETFQRFVTKICSNEGDRSRTLIVNGDFFDFLRVNRIPRQKSQEDVRLVSRWKKFLETIEHTAAAWDLYAADKSEKEYGFKTQDYKSVWRILLIFEGHKVFFRALRGFLGRGENRLIIMKGNHDLELFWEAVRQAFVYFLADEDPERYNELNARIRFYQQSVVINKELYVEHGHRYEEITHTDRDTRSENPRELDLPVGSLFNRYVINKIEEIDPLFDNIKPPTNILKAVALHYPGKLLRIAGYHLVGAWKIVRKYHVAYAAKIVGNIIKVGLPFLVFLGLAMVLYVGLKRSIVDDLGRWLVNAVGSLVGAFTVRWIQQHLFGSGETESLLRNAQEVYRSVPSVRLITFGHTHASEMSLIGGDCWYVNSGTWIPTIELETHAVQDTNTFCVLRLSNDNGMFQREPLLRWDDGLQSLEPMIFLAPSA